MDKIRSKYTHPDFQFVRFRLSNVEFGLEIRSVKEIIRPRELAKPPECPYFIEGFLNLRSISIPVMDLRKRFSLAPVFNDATRIIIASIDGRITGLIVDEVNDITMGGKEVSLKPQSIKHPWDGCIDGVVETGKLSMLIINPSGLLTDAEKDFLDTPLAES